MDTHKKYMDLGSFSYKFAGTTKFINKCSFTIFLK